MNGALLAIGRDWWLPANYSVHGREIDHLFIWILGITGVVFLGVHLLLLVVLIRFRAKPDRAKAHYTHGHRGIEIVWTAIPILILMGLTLASKRVWGRFVYSSSAADPRRAKVLVIGQQFNWSFVYPGPDGKFGRYLVYPKPTDLAWPVGEDGAATEFAGVAGPAALPPVQAIEAINRYIDTINPLGKDFADPDGADDDHRPASERTLFLPVNRPVEIDIRSKDVIHDFYLPNFRVQVYAVPGSQSKVVFTATTTTAELEAAGRHIYRVDDLPALLAQPRFNELAIDIDETSPRAVKDKFGWRYVISQRGSKAETIIRNGQPFPPQSPAQLKAAGIREITAHLPGYLDLACAQLCGLGHYSMQGRVVVLSQEQFDRKFPPAPPGVASAGIVGK